MSAFSGASHNRMSHDTTSTRSPHISSFMFSRLLTTKHCLSLESLQISTKPQYPWSTFVTMIAGTYVTTALGFFSTAYTFLIFRSAWWEAAMEALTRGPLPAPTTIKTLQQRTHLLSFPTDISHKKGTINSMVVYTNYDNMNMWLLTHSLFLFPLVWSYPEGHSTQPEETMRVTLWLYIFLQLFPSYPVWVSSFEIYMLLTRTLVFTRRKLTFWYWEYLTGSFSKIS